MANLKVKDGEGNIKQIKASGTGTTIDPIVTENKVELSAPIPAGTNTIGKVEVTNFPEGGSQVDVTNFPASFGVTGALPAGTNNIGDVDVVSLPPLPAGTNNIGDVDVVSLPPLPAGTNAIGSVQVSNFPASFGIGDSLPAGNNNIGDVDVASLPPLPAGTNNIGQVTIANPVNSVEISGSLPTGVNTIGKVEVTNPVDSVGITGALPAGDNNIGNIDVVSLPPLPTGTNAIGSVQVSNFPANFGIGGSLPAGTNNIGDVDIASLPPLPTGTNNIGQVTIANPVTSVGITGALPAGNNNIGDVDIASLPPLPAGTNNIGDVDIASLPPLPAGTNNIGDVDIASLPSALINGDRLKVETQAITITGGDATAANQTLQLTELGEINDKIPTQSAGRMPVDSLTKTARKRWRDDFPGSSLNPANWNSAIGIGQTITVTGSELQIAMGTTANEETVLTSLTTFNCPCRIQVCIRLSQRIANQEIYLELSDVAGNERAGFLFDATSVTSVKHFALTNGAGTANVSNTTTSSANYTLYEIEFRPSEVTFQQKAADAATARTNLGNRNRQIPDPNSTYSLRIRCKNLATPPASNTTVFIDSVLVEDIEELQAEIANGRNNGSAGNAIATQITNGTITISNTAFTANENASLNTETGVALTGNGTFSGSTRNTSSARNTIRLVAVPDQSGTLFLDQSPNGTLWFQTAQFACTAGVNLFEQKVYLPQYRVRYTNGATAQGSFNLYSMMFSIGA
ncbi:hypothetical protein NIES4101_53660 [Calothrix sp. NIES-4101]|nr:hypothetical protein NIES4101_53660 [Calothrix sp. NIES-4101]